MDGNSNLWRERRMSETPLQTLRRARACIYNALAEAENNETEAAFDAVSDAGVLIIIAIHNLEAQLRT